MISAVISSDYRWEGFSASSFSESDFRQFLFWATNTVGANDIYLETNEPLGLKKDNVTHNVTELPLQYEDLISLLSEIYQQSAASELRSGRFFDFSYSFTHGDRDQKLRFRVNVSAGNSIKAPDEGIELSIRPTTGEPPSVAELGVSQQLIDLTKHQNGFVFVTGPTGSGKTTLIGALLKHMIQTQPIKILTSEDPIEYDYKMIPNRMARVVQCEVGTNIGSFNEAAENMMRRSPDVISMGELRDADSINSGLRIARTGHLVFATGHTHDVSDALDRLADYFLPGERLPTLKLLVATCKAIIHQRLLTRRGGGRIAVQERLVFTPVIRTRLLAALKTDDTLIEALNDCVRDFGLSLLEDIKSKFNEGLLDIEVCLLELAGELSNADLEFFRTSTLDLYGQELITANERDDWIKLLEVLDE